MSVKENDAIWTVGSTVVMILTYFLGRYFPGLTAFFMGDKLYVPTNYHYDNATVFDDTILTWGTDYLLALVMGSIALRISSVKETGKGSFLKNAATLLLGSFSLSTLAGAICHQFLYLELNTWYFRLLWRICVGSVGAAGGLLGMCASEIAKLPMDEKERTARFLIPVVPRHCWMMWSVFFFVVVWFGFYSMKNPACDIFLTGVTQSVPTFYLVAVLFSRKSWENVVSNGVVLMLLLGCLSNVILLPGYDVLNYLQVPDNVCNLFLHTFLFVSWSSQGLAFHQFVSNRAILTDAKKE